MCSHWKYYYWQPLRDTSFYIAIDGPAAQAVASVSEEKIFLLVILLVDLREAFKNLTPLNNLTPVPHYLNQELWDADCDSVAM